MACNDFKTSSAKGKSWLRTLGAIDKYLNIIDLNKFRTNVTQLTEYSKNKYGITERLFLEENGGRKAVVNSKMFYQIDAKNDIWYPENQYLKEDVFEMNQGYLKENDITTLNDKITHYNKTNGRFVIKINEVPNTNLFKLSQHYTASYITSNNIGTPTVYTSTDDNTNIKDCLL